MYNLRFFFFVNIIHTFPAMIAHGKVGIITAQKDLAALPNDISGTVKAGIDSCFIAASAQCFNFNTGIRKGSTAACFPQKLCPKIHL